MQKQPTKHKKRDYNDRRARMRAERTKKTSGKFQKKSDCHRRAAPVFQQLPRGCSEGRTNTRRPISLDLPPKSKQKHTHAKENARKAAQNIKSRGYSFRCCGYRRYFCALFADITNSTTMLRGVRSHKKRLAPPRKGELRSSLSKRPYIEETIAQLRL